MLLLLLAQLLPTPTLVTREILRHLLLRTRNGFRDLLFLLLLLLGKKGQGQQAGVEDSKLTFEKIYLLFDTTHLGKACLLLASRERLVERALCGG